MRHIVTVRAAGRLTFQRTGAGVTGGGRTSQPFPQDTAIAYCIAPLLPLPCGTLVRRGGGFGQALFIDRSPTSRASRRTRNSPHPRPHHARCGDLASQDADCPDAAHSDRLGGAKAEIKADARHERAAVVDDHGDGLPGFWIRHGQSRAERERAMSGSQAVRIEWLATGGVLTLPIVGGNDPLAATTTGTASGRSCSGSVNWCHRQRFRGIRRCDDSC